MTIDLLLTGGLVVDGTGVPGRLADVAVRRRPRRGHRTAGRRPRPPRVIDCTGLVVAPGIVDAHTHYDPQITWDPLCDTAALHGVTTVAAGNCGFSVAPCRRDDHAYVAQVFARVEGMDPTSLDHVDWAFETFEEFLATRHGTPRGEPRHVRRPLGDPSLGHGRRGLRARRHRRRGGGHGRDGRRRHGGRCPGVVVVARPHPPRSRRPPGAQPAGLARRAAGPGRRAGSPRHRLGGLRPRERGGGHRRRRPRPADRAGRAGPACPSSPRGSAGGRRSTRPRRPGSSPRPSSTAPPPPARRCTRCS